MLFLDKLFKKGLPKAAEQAPDSAYSDDKSAGQPAIMPDEYQSLQELQSQRQLLEVKITGSSRSYQSMIIAIDLERGLLWLDDLFPQQLILDAGDELCIRHHRNTEELVIHAPIVALGSSYGTSGIAVELPNFAYYQPRRRFPRYTVGHQSPLSVKIRPIGQEPSFGTLQDISVGGMRLMVAGNLLPHLRHGALMPLCEVNLSDDLHIRCRARICAFRMGRSPYRHTQISIEFIDLEEDRRAALGRFLREQQFNTSVELGAVQQHRPHHNRLGGRAYAA
jgi:c-di-GMP-binding flagellar brake protein YcgR